jgi:hypothetical protein
MSNNTSATNINVDSNVKKEAKKIENRDILVKSFDNREDLKKALNK